MKTVLRLVLLALLGVGVMGGVAAAEPLPSDANTTGWNRAQAERTWVLGLKANAVRGESAFVICQGCHRAGALGRTNGSYPRLAGQHATVLIKQMADIRAGLRDNPTMYPFAKELTDAQELANVSAYIESLCIPAVHGMYEGPDAAKQIADGKVMYEKECIECHKANGEGVKDKFYPVLAGQHYKYLLRQMKNIREGVRTNVPPEMFKVITKYDSTQLVSIAAYLANLNTPASMMMQSGSMCRAAKTR